ncbi:ubiquitin-conjugating enzyme [Trypanosoma brucei equiperdum]|uniref:E2 ubiquitin-conjugating enzyme n=1 Tax=Trypanosoma brucei equiperdum TaxID=630700 RepID=A0A3L6LCY5_9TRYP|nr:ubiquitin-conjugating enzyme [Trypanosoma brucei equiperdum]
MPVSPAAMHLIMRQVQDINSNPTEGIRLVRSDDLSELLFEITGPEGTPFAGGSFQVVFHFDEGYPEVPPRGVFRTKIFHPNIAEKGDICVNVLKRDWNPSLGLRHVLTIVRCLLIEPNAESALNEEAARLLMEDYDAYRRKAGMMTKVHAIKSGRAPMESQRPFNGVDGFQENGGVTSSGKCNDEEENDSNNAVGGGGLRLSLHMNNVDNKGTLGELPASSSLSSSAAAAAATAAKKAVEKKRAALRRI